MVCETRWLWKQARIFNPPAGFLAISGVTQFAETPTRPLSANPGDDGIEQNMSLEYGGYVFHAGGSVCSFVWQEELWAMMLPIFGLAIIFIPVRAHY